MVEDFYKDYDRLIRIACPEYDHCLNLIIKNIPKNTNTLLDLGSGTGNLILSVLNQCPGLKAWGVELQPELIKIANKKTGREDVSFIEGDITKAEWPDVEVITSSLTIHHLTYEQKADIFKKIYTKSNHFLFFDRVKGETEIQEKKNLEYIFDHMRQNGLSEDMIEKAKEDMEKNDEPLTVAEQNKLFDKTGFKYKLLYLKNGFAVYSCSKDAATRIRPDRGRRRSSS